MKKLYIAAALIALCFPAFGQTLNANQVRVNGRVFTIGTNTYTADRDLILNQWYKGHRSAAEARQGDDLSWLNNFTRAYTLDFQEGTLSIGGSTIGRVRTIAFSQRMIVETYGIGRMNIDHKLIYAANTGVLIGAESRIGAINAFMRINVSTFDLNDFVFPHKANEINAPVSSVNTNSGLITFKDVVNDTVASGNPINGAHICTYIVNGETARKLKEADDLAKAARREIPSLMGNFQLDNVPVFNGTHRLTADLNVFAEQDGGSRVVTSLKTGNSVQVLEYGDYADWNGVTARWAKVKTADDNTGWLFSGFLEQLRR